MELSKWIIPQDRVFYDLLEKESSNVVLGALRLEEAIKDFDRLSERRVELRAIERAGDAIAREIYREMEEQFITPIDREDIAKLASLYDDVLDNIEAVMNRLVLYEIERPTPAMLRFAGLIRESVDELQYVFSSMRRMDKKEIDGHITQIDRLENEADDLLNHEMASLFRGGDVMTILKLKEVYEYMEVATDTCEDVGLALRDILLKRA
jgi:predicted phosphate transport protein (TIGR00153 family)